MGRTHSKYPPKNQKMNFWRDIDPPKLGSSRCRMSFHICLPPVMGVLSLTRNSFLKKNINKSSMLRYTNAYKFTIRGMKGVAMARHGPILKDNEATGSGKVFKYLPGLRDTIKKSKMAAKVQKYRNPGNYRNYIYIYIYKLTIDRLGG